MNDRKKKLIELGPEVLANALIDLAVYSDKANVLVERLIATPDENLKRFKSKLALLKRSTRFYDWRASAVLADELGQLLQDIRAGVSEPMTGVQLIADFFRSDNAIFDKCDDSDGNVSMVFDLDGRDLFIEYASKCCDVDKEKVADIVYEMSLTDDYGVRDKLVDCAADYLPETIIRNMIEKYKIIADKQEDMSDKRHYFFLIESLARQIGDAKLFETTRVKSLGAVSGKTFVDIASVYFESGDIDEAYSWLKKIPENDRSVSYERDKLLESIYQKRGDVEKLAELRFQQFRSHPSKDNLRELVAVVGVEQQNKIIDTETAVIMDRKEFQTSDVNFLLSVEKLDEAESYIVMKAETINGQFYMSLLDMAETMTAKKRNLAASLIYRSLLVSILERGYSKAYRYAARYLKILDTLSSSVSGWKNIDNHDIFKNKLYLDHKRKRSFWSKYEA